MSPTTEPLRILLVDDEDLARMRMRALVEACAEPRATVVGEAANAAQAMVWLQQHGQGPDAPAGAAQPACHLVLLDIHMPGRDGLQLADELRRLPHPPMVVFVTAHADHAVKAFDLDAAVGQIGLEVGPLVEGVGDGFAQIAFGEDGAAPGESV